jgi:large subunit ribosomal protein L18
MTKTTKQKSTNRAIRVRSSIRRNNKEGRIRLSIFRSGKHLYAQLIDDQKGITIASTSTLSFEDKGNKVNIKNAILVGKNIAIEAEKHEIRKVVFDKGAYKFHGRVKALAEAAKESNYLEF